MSIELQDLFDQAGRVAPASTLNGDLIIRRGRRIRARRRALVGASALAGVTAVVLGSAAQLDSFPGDGSAGAVLGPASGGGANGQSDANSVPTSPVSPGASNGHPLAASASAIAGGVAASPEELRRVRGTGLFNVSLPDPAPGFPVRRSEDVVDQMTVRPGAEPQWVATFLLAAVPGTVETDDVGQVSGRPKGPEATLLVGEFPMPRVNSAGRLLGHEVVAAPTVAGVRGYVTRFTEKGTSMRALYFSSGKFSVQVSGSDGVTTDQLVALGDALTGLR